MHQVLRQFHHILHDQYSGVCLCPLVLHNMLLLMSCTSAQTCELSISLLPAFWIRRLWHCCEAFYVATAVCLWYSSISKNFPHFSFNKRMEASPIQMPWTSFQWIRNWSCRGSCWDFPPFSRMIWKVFTVNTWFAPKRPLTGYVCFCRLLGKAGSWKSQSLRQLPLSQCPTWWRQMV